VALTLRVNLPDYASMKTCLLALALLPLAACGKPGAANVEEVVANNMSGDDVTEVPDESAQSNVVDEAIGGGNNVTMVDPD